LAREAACFNPDMTLGGTPIRSMASMAEATARTDSGTG
jgi:hypothetical protein